MSNPLLRIASGIAEQDSKCDFCSVDIWEGEEIFKDIFQNYICWDCANKKGNQ